MDPRARTTNGGEEPSDSGAGPAIPKPRPAARRNTPGMQPRPPRAVGDLVIKKHPTFARNLTIVALAGIAAGGLVFMGAGSGLIGPDSDSRIIVMTGIVLVVLVYSLWAGRHVRCPDCRSRCHDYAAAGGNGHLVLCESCGTAWDLGISFSQDT